MKRIVILLAALAVLAASATLAKRSAPAEVTPITSGQIEYRVPHSQMGCVEAWDTKRNELIWRRQIYVVKYTIGLERDVQDVFIKIIELKDNTLIVKNERESEYELALESLQIEVLKGSLVENSK
jgi:hypothetical protein